MIVSLKMGVETPAATSASLLGGLALGKSPVAVIRVRMKGNTGSPVGYWQSNRTLWRRSGRQSGEVGLMKAKASAGRENELWTLLNQAQHAAIRASETELRQLGVPQMHAEVLMIVKSEDRPVTPAEISRSLFREPHTISGLLTRMEKQGLVKRVRDLQRKNMVRIAITDKGERAYRKLSEVNAISSIMSSLSSREQEGLKDILMKLRRRALEELRMRQPLPYP